MANLAGRIQVFSTAGRYLFHVHRERALKLLASGTARAEGQGRIWKILLVRTPGPEIGPPRDLVPQSYRQKYTFRQRLSDGTVVVALKHIPQVDVWAFNMPVQECLCKSN